VSRWPWYGQCPECGRVYALRWPAWNDGGTLTLRRHGSPDICDGSGCDPVDGTLKRTRPAAAAAVMRGAVVIAVVVLSACGGGGTPPPTTDERWSTTGDPRDGWVEIRGMNVFRTCDGSTMVYTQGRSNGGVAAVPNAPECGPR
jgi:hypothetical protein